MEGGVGPVRSWFLSDCGVSFPRPGHPPLSPELPACRESVSASSQHSALLLHFLSPPDMRQQIWCCV